MDKQKDLDFIKAFSKITISSICNDLKIDRPNLLRGRCSAENVARVKKEIEKRFKELD